MDLIERQDAIDAVSNMLRRKFGIGGDLAEITLAGLPSAQPETHEERTETHACDLISRQAAIDAILAVTGNSSVRELYEHVQEHELSDMWSGGVNAAIDIIIAVPPVQPDSKELSPTHKALDTISRQAAIDAIKALYEWHDTVTEDRTIDHLKRLPSAQPEPKWIPISERLPEKNGRYLVTRGLNACGSLWNRIYIANYSNLMGIKSVKIWWQGNVGKSDFERLDDILAWMPLPKPYRAERRTDVDANT